MDVDGVNIGSPGGSENARRPWASTRRTAGASPDQSNRETPAERQPQATEPPRPTTRAAPALRSDVQFAALVRRLPAELLRPLAARFSAHDAAAIAAASRPLRSLALAVLVPALPAAAVRVRANCDCARPPAHSNIVLRRLAALHSAPLLASLSVSLVDVLPRPAPAIPLAALPRLALLVPAHQHLHLQQQLLLSPNPPHPLSNSSHTQTELHSPSPPLPQTIPTQSTSKSNSQSSFSALIRLARKLVARQGRAMANRQSSVITPDASHALPANHSPQKPSTAAISSSSADIIELSSSQHCNLMPASTPIETLIAIIIASSPRLTHLHLSGVPSLEWLDRLYSSIGPIKLNLISFTVSLVDPVSSKQPRKRHNEMFNLAPRQWIDNLFRGPWHINRNQFNPPVSDDLYNPFEPTAIRKLWLSSSLQHIDIPLHLVSDISLAYNASPPYMNILNAFKEHQRPLLSLALTLTGTPRATQRTLDAVASALDSVLEAHPSITSFSFNFRKRTNERHILDWHRLLWERVLGFLGDRIPNAENLDLDMSAVNVTVPPLAFTGKPHLRSLRLAAGVRTLGRLIASYAQINPFTLRHEFSDALKTATLDSLGLTIYRSRHSPTDREFCEILKACDSVLTNVRHLSVSLGYGSHPRLMDPHWEPLLGRLESLRIVADGGHSISKKQWQDMAYFVKSAQSIRSLEWARSRKQQIRCVDNWSYDAISGTTAFLESIIRHPCLRRVFLEFIPLEASALDFFFEQRLSSNACAAYRIQKLTATIPVVVSRAEIYRCLAREMQRAYKPKTSALSSHQTGSAEVAATSTYATDAGATTTVDSADMHVSTSTLVNPIPPVQVRVFPADYTTNGADVLQHIWGRDDEEKTETRYSLAYCDVVQVSIGEPMAVRPITPPKRFALNSLPHDP